LFQKMSCTWLSVRRSDQQAHFSALRDCRPTSTGLTLACRSFQMGLLPQMDEAYSTLLTDLKQRGLLDETLVTWMGEFGRTPKINARGGRDHWGHVYSLALAGAGIKKGVL